jgi:hypothetical protein
VRGVCAVTVNDAADDNFWIKEFETYEEVGDDYFWIKVFDTFKGDPNDAKATAALFHALKSNRPIPQFVRDALAYMLKNGSSLDWSSENNRRTVGVLDVSGSKDRLNKIEQFEIAFTLADMVSEEDLTVTDAYRRAVAERKIPARCQRSAEGIYNKHKELYNRISGDEGLRKKKRQRNENLY